MVYASAKKGLGQLRKVRKSLPRSDSDEKSRALAKIAKIEEAFRETSAVKFVTGTSYIRFMLGHVNVKAFSVTERRMLRDEYVMCWKLEAARSSVFVCLFGAWLVGWLVHSFVGAP